MKHDRWRGYSLIEMMTVLLIIMVLVAITFPLLFKAKAKSKETVCISNLRQTYLGIQMYEQEYDELPYFSNSHPSWIRYTGNTTLRCPNTVGQGNRYDYSIVAGPLLDIATNPASATWNAMLEECKLKRGDQFPWAFDPNHKRNIDGYQGNGQRVLLVRANGSVQSVPLDMSLGSSGPCHQGLPLDIQH